MTRFGAALLVLVLAGSGVAGADEWPAARVFVVFSDNGRYFVRFVPGESVGDTVGFSAAPKGQKTPPRSSTRCRPIAATDCSTRSH